MQPFSSLRIIFASTLIVLAALPAYALDLHGARASGKVGETLSGYVEAVTPSTEVSSLVSDVNAKRLAEYTRISKQNGQPVDVVAKLAAEQIINGLPKGSKYKDASGGWKTK